MKYNEDLPVRRFPPSLRPPFTPFTVDRYPSHRSSDPLHRLPCPLPRHRMRHRTRTRPPAVSLARKGAPPGWSEQLFRVGVQFLGHVFPPAVVPDGASGQRVHCGYVASDIFILALVTR